MGVQGLSRPEVSEYPAGFGKYVALVPEGDVLAFLEGQLGEALGLLRGLTEAEGMRVDAPYAWSVKEVVGHITDAERIFAYRLLRIGRGDGTPLASFDENAYVKQADFGRCAMGELVEEFELARRSHLLLMRHMGAEAWGREGNVCGHRATARAFPYVMAGHAKHHLDILRKRLGR